MEVAKVPSKTSAQMRKRLTGHQLPILLGGGCLRYNMVGGMAASGSHSCRHLSPAPYLGG